MKYLLRKCLDAKEILLCYWWRDISFKVANKKGTVFSHSSFSLKDEKQLLVK